MRRSFKFRLEPNKEQKGKLFDCLDLCRELYNAAIEERRAAYHNWIFLGKPEKWKNWPSRSSQQKGLTELKKIEGLTHFKTKIHSQPLQEVLKRVDEAYNKFFDNLASSKVHPPKFKGRHRYCSITYTQYGSACHLNNNHLYLSRIGPVKIRLSRKVEGDIKTVTIKWEDGHFWAIFSCNNVPLELRKATGKKTAIDYGLEHVVNLEDGRVIEQPRFLKNHLNQLRLEQRKLSRKKIGGHNRHKQRIKVASIHTKIKNSRADFQFKEARKLVIANDIIAFEKHKLAFMTQHPRLAQSAHDRAIGKFHQKLVSQAQKAGYELVGISTRDKKGVGNSQRCLCGKVAKKKLSQRKHVCDSCKVKVSRDS